VEGRKTKKKPNGKSQTVTVNKYDRTLVGL